MALAPGSKLGPYTVTAQIGAGGMGEVYILIKVPAHVSSTSSRWAAIARRSTGVIGVPEEVNGTGSSTFGVTLQRMDDADIPRKRRRSLRQPVQALMPRSKSTWSSTGPKSCWSGSRSRRWSISSNDLIDGDRRGPQLAKSHERQRLMLGGSVMSSSVFRSWHHQELLERVPVP